MTDTGCPGAVAGVGGVASAEAGGWCVIPAVGAVPCERMGFSASVVGDRIYVLAGYDLVNPVDRLRDMFVFNTGACVNSSNVVPLPEVLRVAITCCGWVPIMGD